MSNCAIHSNENIKKPLIKAFYDGQGMGLDFATGQKLFQLDYYIGKRNGTKMRMIIQNHIFDSASLKTLLSRLGKVSLSKWKKCEEKAKLTLRMLDVEAPESLIQEAKDTLDADETSTSLMINTCCTVSDPKKPSAYLLALIVLQSGVTEGENRREIQDILSFLCSRLHRLALLCISALEENTRSYIAFSQSKETGKQLYHSCARKYTPQ